MKSILLYNLYPKTIWESVTEELLANVPHDDIVVNVTMPWSAWLYKHRIKKALAKYGKIKTVFFTPNKKNQGEAPGFDKMRRHISFEEYDIISYVHSKGTSRRRKNTGPIKDWTNLMRYFVIERLDLCQQTFEKGYYLYGVDLSNNIPDKQRAAFKDTKFIYEGNFVSLNNRMLGKKFIETECQKSYYGVERFWGTLCEREKAFCIHYSKADHYNELYPPSKYTTEDKINKP